MFSWNSWAAVGHVNLDAVRTRQAEPSPLLYGGHFRNAPLPKVWRGSKRDRAPGRRVLQRVIQEVRCALLHFLIIKFEIRYRRIERSVRAEEFNARGAGALRYAADAALAAPSQRADISE